MRKPTLYALLISLLLPFSLRGTFDEKNGFLWHPAFSSYSFLPADYLTNTKMVFAASGTELYSMKECKEVQVFLHASLPFARVGIDASFFGSDLYNESVLGVSLLTGTEIALGIRPKVMRLGIRGYQTGFLQSTDILFSSNHALFYFETCCNNAISFGYHSEAEKPVSSYGALARFYPAHWYSLNLRISFSELTGLATEIGNGFKASENAWIGGGFDLQTKKLASHLMFSLNRCCLSYAISVHPALGITHTAGVILLLCKQKVSIQE